MTAQEETGFAALFVRMRGVFQLRCEANELQQIAQSYIRAFRRWSLSDLEAGADVWIGKGARFPKPFEWIASIPRRGAIELRTLPYQEAWEHQRAERLHYEDDPCRCPSCHEAEVTHRSLRYVPNDPEERVHLGERVVCAGHWAHGWELHRWYLARDGFMGKFADFKRAKDFRAKQSQNDE